MAERKRLVPKSMRKIESKSTGQRMCEQPERKWMDGWMETGGRGRK